MNPNMLLFSPEKQKCTSLTDTFLVSAMQNGVMKRSLIFSLANKYLMSWFIGVIMNSQDIMDNISHISKISNVIQIHTIKSTLSSLLRVFSILLWDQQVPVFALLFGRSIGERHHWVGECICCCTCAYLLFLVFHMHTDLIDRIGWDNERTQVFCSWI